jgi:hypothetical protein
MKKTGLNGNNRQGLNGSRFFSERAALYLFKDTLVKRKFLSLSEVLLFFDFRLLPCKTPRPFYPVKYVPINPDPTNVK